MPLSRRLVLAVLAGVAVALAFEPFAAFVLLPPGVAAFALLSRSTSPGRAVAVGVGFGFAFMLVLLPWLRVIGTDAWIGLALLEGAFYGLLGLGGSLVGRLRLWPLWTALLWVAVEVLRSSFPFGGFPWGRLAFATAGTPVADLMAYVGAAGTTFAVALVGTCLAWAVLEARRSPVLGSAAVLLPALVVSSGGLFTPWAPAASEEPDDVVRVAAVQGDVPGAGMDAFAERRVVLENHVEATLELAARIDAGQEQRPDLVVWPENSTDIDPFSDPSVYADIQAAVDAVDVPVLVGAMVSGDAPEDVYNQGIVWLPGSGPSQRYSKNHPVPFGEYIPFRDQLAPYFSRLDQIPRDMVAGTEPGLLDMGGTTVGDVICFEVAYDELVRDVVDGGSDLVVVQTNNATYMGTGQIEQQFAISRLRAIETNRHVVVAATNGVSGIIGPDGEVVERAPTRERAVLLSTLPVHGGDTPAMRWGSAVEALLVVGAVVAAAAGLRLQYRRRRSGAETLADPRAEAVPAGRSEA